MKLNDHGDTGKPELRLAGPSTSSASGESVAPGLSMTDNLDERLRAVHETIRVQVGSKTHGGGPEYREHCRACGTEPPCLTVAALDDLAAQLRDARAEIERQRVVIVAMDDDADLALADRDEAVEAESQAGDVLTARLAEVERERDELRAEVERVRRYYTDAVEDERVAVVERNAAETKLVVVRGALATARRWIMNCVDPIEVGMETKHRMLATLDAALGDEAVSPIVIDRERPLADHQVVPSAQPSAHQTTVNDLPVLIAIGGYGGTGKDTLAAGLVTGYGYRLDAFGSHIAALLADINPIVTVNAAGQPWRWNDIQQRYGYQGAKEIDGVLRLMIDTGEHIRLRQPDFWVRCVLGAIPADGAGRRVPTVLTGVRSLAECRVLRAAGAVLIRVNRPGVGSRDVQELQLDEIQFDYVVDNDSTPDVLCRRALQALGIGM